MYYLFKCECFGSEVAKFDEKPTETCTHLNRKCALNIAPRPIYKVSADSAESTVKCWKIREQSL